MAHFQIFHNTPKGGREAVSRTSELRGLCTALYFKEGTNGWAITEGGKRNIGSYTFNMNPPW